MQVICFLSLTYPPTSFLLSWPWKRRIIAFLLAQRFVVWEGLVLSRQGHEMSKKVFANKKAVFPTKMSPTFNHNWHEGDTFISLSFLDQILSADFLSKISKLFWRWKSTSIGLIWHPVKLIESKALEYKVSPNASS